jgi:hypothetical protein
MLTERAGLEFDRAAGSIQQEQVGIPLVNGGRELPVCFRQFFYRIDRARAGELRLNGRRRPA